MTDEQRSFFAGVNAWWNKKARVALTFEEASKALGDVGYPFTNQSEFLRGLREAEDGLGFVRHPHGPITFKKVK